MNKMKLNIQLFAITKRTTFTEIPLTDNDIVNNYSSLKVTVYFDAGNNVTWFSSKTLYIAVNGVLQSKNVSLSKGGSVTATFTYNNILHNADGTKSVNWDWHINTGTSALGNLADSGTRTLQTIPRASEPSLSSSNIDLGSSVTISTNRVSESFTHTISYSFESASGVIAENVTTSTSWTPSLDLASQIPSATSGTCTITCTTYNGSTLVGTKSINLILNVPSGVVPSVSIGTLSEANSTMRSLNWGVFVQNKSQLSIPITASGIYGSSIGSIITAINNSTFSGSSVTTTTLVTAGTNTIESTAKDTRGRSASTSKTYNVVAYSNPQITNAVAVRCLQDGTESDEGTYLKYSFSGSISPVSNHNGHLFRIGYSEKDAENYTYIDINTTDYSINLTDQVLNLNLDTNIAYDIKFEASDTFTTSYIERQVDTGFDLMNFNASGKAMAIGKVSEAGANEELLEIGIPVDITNPAVISSNGETFLRYNASKSAVLSSNGSELYLRPNGTSNSTGQVIIYTNGLINGEITSLGNTGTGNTSLTYHQTSESYFGSSADWAHYIIANHGDGASYYNFMIRLPFWGVPEYQRQMDNASNRSGWKKFVTDETEGDAITIGPSSNITSSISTAWAINTRLYFDNLLQVTQSNNTFTHEDGGIRINASGHYLISGNIMASCGNSNLVMISAIGISDGSTICESYESGSTTWQTMSFTPRAVWLSAGTLIVPYVGASGSSTLTIGNWKYSWLTIQRLNRT